MFESIKTPEELMKIGKEEKWQVFEKLVAHIFEEHGVKTLQNKVIVFSSKKKRQYDVIAEGTNHVYLIECKKWSNGRYKSSALKKSVIHAWNRDCNDPWRS
jgi:Holliday junction resolvase